MKTPKMMYQSGAHLGARQKCKPYDIVDSGPNLVLLEESEPNSPFIALTPLTTTAVQPLVVRY